MAAHRDHSKASRIRNKIKLRTATREDLNWLARYDGSRKAQGRRPDETMTWLKEHESNGANGAATVNDDTVESTGAPPSLGSLAGESDAHAENIGTGGQCPGCREAISDSVKVCPKCGVWARLNECQKCHLEVKPGSYCQGCGRQAPIAPEKPIVPSGNAPTLQSPEQVAAAQAQAQAAQAEIWTDETAGGFAELVDFGLTLDGIKVSGSGEDDIGALTDAEKAVITRHTTPVLNKYFRGAGKYAELINLGGAVFMLCAPKLLIRHIIIPRREREKMEMERMRLENERKMHAAQLEEQRKQREAHA